MRPREDYLQSILAEAENKSSPLELDQIAFALAKLGHAGVNLDDYTRDRPKLKAQVDDCLAQLKKRSQEMQSRSGILAAGGLDLDHPPRDLSKTIPLAVLSFHGWVDRDDRVGQVADALVRIYGR